LAQLATISGLQYLNLVGTKITATGIAQLKTLKNLQWLYLYKTGYTSKDWSTVKAIFPKTTIDTGGYRVPLLKEDTTLVKEPVKKY
jgi:hypothetical protein